MPVEHFCTLFDFAFLPFGLTLWQSLQAHAGPYKLWILCMDRKVEDVLRLLALENVGIIPLESVESRELLAVKPGRSAGEYCWTMTPFIFSAVFVRAPDAARVTYLDADLFFFGNPALLLSELPASGKTVLITEHAYDPEYDMSAESGRFCVQFNTFGRDPASLAILRWWQERCLEWCYNRAEEGKFGDQKYLDIWPEKFGKDVHVLRQTERTLAPWNVLHFARCGGGKVDPILYHFHGFRPVGSGKALLYTGYRVGSAGNRLYDAYLAEFKRAWKRLKDLGIATTLFPIKQYPLEALREIIRLYIRRNRRYGTLS